MPNQSVDKSRKGQLPRKPEICHTCKGKDFWWKEPYMDNFGNGPIRIPGRWHCNGCDPNPDEYITTWPNVYTIIHTKIVKPPPDDF